MGVCQFQWTSLNFLTFFLVLFVFVALVVVVAFLVWVFDCFFFSQSKLNISRKAEKSPMLCVGCI